MGSPTFTVTGRRRWIFLVFLLAAGVLVYLPAIRAHYLLDDYLHASMIDGTFPAKRGPADLYDFVNDADRAALTERGMLPWWAHPRLKIRFFRPLPSLLRWADHRLLGRAPLPLHLHSVLWWVAAVLAARALFRRHLPPRAAILATVVFALAPCHALPLAWLANREALVSLVFGTLALGAHARWRDEQRPRDALIAALFFALSMSGGEYSMCFGGYLVAFEIFTRGQGVLRRALGLAPFAVPAAVYLSVRAALGYGTEGSGFYIDPFREPVAFLGAAPRRLLTLIAQGWLSLDGETLMGKSHGWPLALVVAACVALVAPPLRRAFAAQDDGVRRSASWLLLGSFFALLPVMAAHPSPRLLGVTMLGVAAAVALLLDHAWFPAGAEEQRRAVELTRLAALALGFAHLVHGPGTAWLIGWGYQRQSAYFARTAAELHDRFTDPAHTEVRILRGMGGSFFLPFAIDPRGAPPARWRILAQTGHALVLRRDARTLDIVVPAGSSVFPAGAGNLFRDFSSQVKAGETFTLPGLKVTVLEVGADGPRAVRYEMDRDLEAEPYLWMTETNRGFFEATPPKPGFGHPFDP